MENNQKKRKVIKIGVVGDTMAGKTQIINTFLNIEFNELILGTIGKEKLESKVKMKDGRELKLIIWDTAGGERFHSISIKSIRNSHGIIVVFDLTKRYSFNNVDNWIKEIKENIGDIPIVLFGNKCDLIERREVSEEEAIEFSNKRNIEYFETSAKENINFISF